MLRVKNFRSALKRYDLARFESARQSPLVVEMVSLETRLQYIIVVHLLEQSDPIE